MKRILITGGTGKIGGRLVAHFLRDDWEVICTTRKKENINLLVERGLLTAQEIEKIEVLELDFLEKDIVQTKVAAYFSKHPQNLPDVLVNNARNLSLLKVQEDGTSSGEMIAAEYLMDVIIPYELSMLFANAKESPLRSIINISSIYGIVPFNPNLYDNFEQSAPIQYSLAKAACIHLSKELAVRLSKKKIKVNTVSYGGVGGRVNEEFLKKYGKLCPSGNMLSEEEVIGPVAFLASESSNGITGHNLVQDGGWTIW